MQNRLQLRISAQGIFRGILAILYGPLIVPALLEVHRQLGGALPSLRSVPQLGARANTACRWQTGIDDFLIEGMHESIASCYRPVWPGLLATRLQQLPPACPPLTIFFNVHYFRRQARRGRPRRVFEPC